VSSKPKYPLGTVAWYGPENTRATKIAAAVFKNPKDENPIIKRWFSKEGDLREDETIAQEIVSFFQENGVQQSAVSDRILGCPHEEGIDYPTGGVCLQCPFWWNLDRFTHEPLCQNPGERHAEKVGRNEPCPCGSGKKYKKCCGA
jgi:preprotein translocase subunit SecA